MTPEQERWAEALAVERMHGDQAAAFMAGRIADLDKKGDQAGVARWTEIAACVAKLRRNPGTKF